MQSYATADLSLSAFLNTFGHEIVEIRYEGGRGVFVFSSTPRLKSDVLRWGNDDLVSLRPRTFVNSLRDLKGIVARGS